MLLAFLVFVGVVTLPAALLAPFGLGGALLLLVEVPLVALVVLLAAGLRRWRRGSRDILVVADFLVLVPLALLSIMPPLIFGIPTTARPPFPVTIPLAAVAGLGLVAGLLVRPPGAPVAEVEVSGTDTPPDGAARVESPSPYGVLIGSVRGSAKPKHQRDEEGGQGEQVGGVGDEGDVNRLRDRLAP